MTEKLRFIRIAFLTKSLVIIQVFLRSIADHKGLVSPVAETGPVFAATLPSSVSSLSVGLCRRGDNLYQILAFYRLTALQVDLME